MKGASTTLIVPILVISVYVFMFRLITILLTLITIHLSAKPGSEGAFELWGVDAKLPSNKNEALPFQKAKLSRGQKTCRSMIEFFQVYISPIDGPRSSFYPTSSQYALEAIEKHGVLSGIALGCDRLMRENGEPWIYDRTDKYGIERKVDPVR